MPLLRAFSSSSGFYKVIKSPYLSLEKAKCKNNNLPRRHTTNFISLEDLLMARNTLIFILQHLGLLINIKKSYLERTSTLEFLGVIVDSSEITLSLPKEKLRKGQNHCQGILEKGEVTAMGLRKVIGRLPSTTIVFLPAPLLYCHLQHR